MTATKSNDPQHAPTPPAEHASACASAGQAPHIDPASKSMDDIVALCKRRGFVYPASEIYGGINGFWDYGPLGVALKNNIRDHWWKHMVECPPIGLDGDPLQLVGLDSAIIQNPKTWEASGHLAGFNDPMVDDTETKQRFRADHLSGVLEFARQSSDASADCGMVDVMDWAWRPLATINASSPHEALNLLMENRVVYHNKLRFKVIRVELDDDAPQSLPESIAVRLIGKNGNQIKAFISELILEDISEFHDQLPSPFSGNARTLTKPRQFNLMFLTYVGAMQSDDSKAYLRPETAQGIFLNYKNILDTMRVKVPFGVAQIGKAFRNEVNPRNFIFRSREFEQMELEWFCHPDDARQWYDFWKSERMKWWESLGIARENLRFRDHDEDELAHYSKMCVDVEYKYPFTAPDFGELEGIAHRGDFDLTQHAEHSGLGDKLKYFDQERNERYLPNVIEPSSGLTRAVLVLLCEAYTPDPNRPSGVYMKFHPKFAPVTAAVFPLVNKQGMPEVARDLYLKLRERWNVQYDAKQNIGKRYARMDEIGTPYCFTIDGQTLEDQTVTVRDRDTLSQERIHLDQVERYLADHVG